MKNKQLFLITVFILNLLYVINTFACFHCNCNGWSDPWSYDSMGAREACRGGLPTDNERMRLIRLNTDPFNTIYEVQRQYCWFCFDGNCLLSGNVSSVQFTNDDLFHNRGFGWGDGHPKNVFIDKVALFMYTYPPPSEASKFFEQSGSNTSKRDIVCAYYCEPTGSACNPWFNNWEHALIGCVEAPLYPGPPTYNNVLVAGTSAIVDNTTTLQGYIGLGSTFDQPLIRMNVLSPIGAVEKSFTLRYVYQGDNSNVTNYNTCGSFNGSKITYCAQIPSYDPSQVCACIQEQCKNEQYLGCVPRPSISDSHYTTIAKFVDYIDQNGDHFPSINYMIVRQTLGGKTIYIDKNGNKAVEGSDGNKYIIDNSGGITKNLAKQPVRYDYLPLTPELPSTYNESSTSGSSSTPLTLPIREYYEKNTQKGTALVRDISPEVYGVQFSTIIPRFNQGGFYKVNISAQRPVQNSNCVIYSVEQGVNNNSVPQHIVPTGKRYRDLCCPSGASQSAYANCSTPPVSCASSSFYTQDCVADFAICPGVYGGPENSGQLDRICLVPSGSWDFINSSTPVCAEIPNNFNITPLSGKAEVCNAKI